MEATADDVGRIVLPKPLRDRLRLVPGTKVDVSEYGDGLHVAVVSRTARLEMRDGRLVAVAETPVTDDDGLIALAAKRSGVPLASRNRRAEATDRRFGLTVEMLS